MTLDEKLTEILKQYYNDMYSDYDRGGPDPTPSTIAAIKQAVIEALPGEKIMSPQEVMNADYYLQATGWNAYREEVLKVLEEK